MLECLLMQANCKSWMNDSWELLHGETVEREVSNAHKVGRDGQGHVCKKGKI